jgi:Heavy metal binding domain
MEQITSLHGYYCATHPNVRYTHPGTCPHCGQELLSDGTRRSMLRQIISNPTHIVIMAALMVGVMAVGMMLMR